MGVALMPDFGGIDRVSGLLKVAYGMVAYGVADHRFHASARATLLGRSGR